jgi:hypothetical protein
MHPVAERLRAIVPSVWAGVLLGVAALGTPAPFAVLARPDAGRVVAYIFEREGMLSLFLGVVVLLLERARARSRVAGAASSPFSVEVGLALGTVFCTVAGYYALQPLMESARAGQGRLSFAQLHAVSLSFFGLKIALVLALAWRAARR